LDEKATAKPVFFQTYMPGIVAQPMPQPQAYIIQKSVLMCTALPR
jgi:hypothetical protein